MRCLACGADNRDDARFCAACGVRVAARCATCERELLPGARFCDGCGAPVVASAGAAETSGEQTRKTLTIVFADLQGSTGLQERMDPESVRALMGRYYAAMREAVEAHGGKVVKFVGDGTMAVFGVPEVAEDDALRAVRAAVDMQTAFESLAQEHDLALRVGVNTGEVVVDADDADVVGDAVNVASRLEGAAGPGEVVVGEETWRLTRHAARFDAPTALALKGRAEAVAAHRLVSIDDDGADTTPAPFVGRTTELQMLHTLFDEIVEQRQPRLATVIGSPGVGKSRLVQQLRTVLGDNALTVRGQCDQHGGATFAPIAGLLDGLGPLTDLLDNDSERDRLLTATEGLAGTGPQATPEETFWAVRRVLETAARHKPVIAVLDDLHWAEPLLLDLVEHLAEWLDQPVLLVAVARPELRELRPSLTEPHRRPGALIALEGLERDATEELACELLGADRAPVELLDRLAVSSDGNPLFVRELVRMLIDDGVVRRDEDNEWVLAVDAAEMEVPPTIQSLLAARLDRLRPQERTVLERAAVIGAEVYRGALDELVPPEIRNDLDSLLEALRRKELLEPAGTYWIDERVLRFHHALIREAAYRRLLKESRAGLHERVAGWLVAKTGGGADHDETVGFHLEQAQANLRSLGPLDEHGRQLATDAAARLGSAARRALDRDDLLAAAGLAGRAVACLDPDDRGRADILLTRCEALLGAGDVAAAGPAIEELQRLGTDSRRIEAWATCFAVQHTALVDPRSLGDAEPRLVDAAAILDGAGDAAGAAKAHRVHASLLARLGRVADCEAALDRALGAARAAGDRRQMTSVLGAAPLAALWGPSPVPRAGGRCLDVIRLARITTGAAAVEATSIRCQAVLEAFRGRTDAARSLIASARGIAEELGLRHGLLEVELFAGIVELCVGDAAAAADHLRRAQDGFTVMGVTVDAAQAAALRGRAALALGHIDEALDYVATSEQLGGQDLKTSIAWRAVEAEVLAVRGNVAEATKLAEAAVALAAPTDALVDHADALAALAAVHAAAGDTAAAQRVAAEARALYEQKGATALAVGLAEGSGVSAARQSAGPGEMPAVANAASRMFEEASRLVVAGRLDELAARYSPDLVLEDRRAGMGTRVEGPADNVEHVRTIRSLGLTGIDSDVVAVRGDRLALIASQWHAGYDVELLAIVGIDADGLGEQSLLYDPAELAVAMEDLDALYLAQEGDNLPLAERRVIETVSALNGHDWDVLGAGCNDDLAFVDHRPAGHGEGQRAEYFIEFCRSMAEVDSGFVEIVNVLDSDEGLVLLSSEPVLTGPGGSSYERSGFIIVGLTATGGLIHRFEIFGVDQLELARVRYRELSAPSAALGNAASAALERMFRCVLDRRPDDAPALFAADMHHEDRRPGMAVHRHGRDASVENVRVMSSFDLSAIESEVLAVRGAHLALVSSLWRGGEYELSLVIVVRADFDGRLQHTVVFDRDDLKAAVVELDDLYLAEAGDTLHPSERIVLEVVAALNRQDWTMRTRMVQDFTFVDHQPAGFGEVHGADVVIGYYRTMAELDPTVATLVNIEATSDRAVLLSVLRTSGNMFGRPGFVILCLAGAGQLLSRYEAFEVEQADEAWGRYRELSAPASAVIVGNAASATFERLLGLLREGRADETAALVATDMHYEDVRPGMQATLDGRSANVEHFRVVCQMPIEALDVDVVAVRGERLALVKTLWHAGTFEAEIMTIVRLDTDGVMDLHLDFDPADLGAALAELDDLYAAQLGEGEARCLRVNAALTSAQNQRNWDAFSRALREDVRAVDHRHAGFGEIVGVDAFVEHARTMIDMAPDAVLVVRQILAVDERCALAETVALLGGSPGDAYEHPRVILSALDVDGRVGDLEFFAPEQLEEAWARYRELSAASTAGEVPANHVVRLLQRAIRSALGGQLDEGSFTADIVFEDRRPGFAVRLEGHAAMLDMARIILRMGVPRVDVQPVAVRGDSLAVVRALWGTEDGVEVEVVNLVRTAAGGGPIDLVVGYDPADLVSALVELDERYAVGEGADHAEIVRLGTAFMQAYAGREWEALRGVLAEDVVLDDHGQVGSGRADGIDALVERNRILVELAPDFAIIVRRYLAFGERHGLCEFSGVGTTAAGAHYDLPRLLLVTLRTPAGPIERMDFFDVEQADVAWQRFRELTRPAENAAVQNARRVGDALLAGDLQALDDLYVSDLVGNDRRAGLQLHETDRSMMFQVLRDSIAAGFRAFSVDVVAERGERLALCKIQWTLSPDYVVDWLLLNEVDGSGRAVSVTFFDEDDLDDALGELEKKFLAGEGAPYAAWMERPLLGALTALARRDWNALRELYVEDVAYIDHLPAGSGEYRGIESVIEYHRMITEIAPTYRNVVRRQLAIGDHIVLSEFAGLSEEQPGGAGSYELVNLLVTTHDAAGRTTRIERFASEDLDAAWACYRELGGQP